MRLQRLHGTSGSNLADPTLRTSSNLSSVMQHWNPIAQEVQYVTFLIGKKSLVCASDASICSIQSECHAYCAWDILHIGWCMLGQII